MPPPARRPKYEDEDLFEAPLFPEDAEAAPLGAEDEEALFEAPLFPEDAIEKVPAPMGPPPPLRAGNGPSPDPLDELLGGVTAFGQGVGMNVLDDLYDASGNSGAGDYIREAERDNPNAHMAGSALRAGIAGAVAPATLGYQALAQGLTGLASEYGRTGDLGESLFGASLDAAAGGAGHAAGELFGAGYKGVRKLFGYDDLAQLARAKPAAPPPPEEPVTLPRPAPRPPAEPPPLPSPSPIPEPPPEAFVRPYETPRPPTPTIPASPPPPPMRSDDVIETLLSDAPPSPFSRGAEGRFQRLDPRTAALRRDSAIPDPHAARPLDIAEPPPRPPRPMGDLEPVVPSVRPPAPSEPPYGLGEMEAMGPPRMRADYPPPQTGAEKGPGPLWNAARALTHLPFPGNRAVRAGMDALKPQSGAPGFRLDVDPAAATAARVGAQAGYQSVRDDVIAYADPATTNYALSAVLGSGTHGLSPEDEEAMTSALVSGNAQQLRATDFRLRMQNPAYARAVERELRSYNEETY